MNSVENGQKGQLWPREERLRERGLLGLGGGSIREEEQPRSAKAEVTTDRLFKVDNSAFLCQLTEEGRESYTSWHWHYSPTGPRSALLPCSESSQMLRGSASKPGPHYPGAEN